jgi:hypothetical protein
VLDEVRVLIEDALDDGASERDLMLVLFFPESLLVRTLGTLYLPARLNWFLRIVYL